MPSGAVYVGRPTVWGNPFAVSRSSDFHGLPGSWFVRRPDGTTAHPDEDTQASARKKAVELYARQVLEQQGGAPSLEAIRTELAGHDLVCWCPTDQSCHADFLLAAANTAPAGTQPARTGSTRP
ncbi:DUF4326 domain-containing protein [Nocardioides anomalus]|nr:DUF4326 domain-containing protein [Nocardioides anomalus]